MATLRLQALFVINLLLLLQFGTHQCLMATDLRPISGGDETSTTTSISKLSSGDNFRPFCFPRFCHTEQLRTLGFVHCWCCFKNFHLRCFSKRFVCKELC
ncbi:hypothetical protein DCAR_0934209 [Daucus carota subsp. sativus]|uniref:Uncharacterized protein n=1 Tax=Daucus carota subsp. sativus TaxID=79200 RepID=A0A175YFX3_DAUCS|nr:hypothetical protein DCAR_0934209 [Daucus carota subsp. sativus]